MKDAVSNGNQEEELDTDEGRSLNCKTNSKVPRTDPWGTPEEIAWQDDTVRSTALQIVTL